MRQFRLDEYDSRIQAKIEAMGLTIVLVMFQANRVLVIAKESK